MGSGGLVLGALLLMVAVAASPAPKCTGLSCFEACEANDGAACVMWASYIQRADRADLRTLMALPTWSKACRLGVVDACISVASIAANGMGVPRDVAHGAAMLERLCRSPADDAACSALFAIEAKDPSERTALEAPRKRALPHLQAACTSSSDVACWVLHDATQKAEWLQPLCQRGDGSACLALAETHTPPDAKLLKKAVQLLDAACNAAPGDEVCYRRRHAIETHPAAAEAACSLGVEGACQQKATLRTYRDDTKCADLDVRACESLHKAGALSAERARDVCLRTAGKSTAALCLIAARLDEWDSGMLKEACARGSVEACSRASTQTAEGECVDGDVVACKKAIAGGASRASLSDALLRGCTRFNSMSCEALAEVQDQPVRAQLARKSPGCRERRDRGCFGDIRVKTVDDARFGCTVGAVQACEQGWLLSSKTEADEDFLEIGCDLASVALCEAFAARATDPWRRLSRLDFACSQTSVAACRAAAAMTCRGDGVTKDLQNCAAFELRACRLGDRAACDSHAALTR